MPSNFLHNNRLQFILAVALSSFAYYYSTGFHNVWVLTWLAPLPICIYALRASAISTVCAGYFASFIGASNPLVLMYGSFLFKILLYANIVHAAAFAIALIIFRYMAIRSKHWAASFIFAGGLTAFEFVTSLHSPDGVIGSIAYTQIANLPVIQIASITGIWGITFLLFLIPAGIALAWHYRQNRQLSMKAGCIPAGLLLLTIVFGVYRLYIPAQGSSLKIGIAAVATTLEQYIPVVTNKDPQQVSDTIQRYTRAIELLAQAGAEVVLLPEKILTLHDQYNILQHLRTVARQNTVHLIVGLNNRDNASFYNSAYVFAPNGELLLKYDKQHLLPAYEGKYTPGDTLGIVKTSAMGTWGVEICKDMDFIQPALTYSQQEINMMFVPALDFHDDGWTHGRVAIMRGVEGDYAVARAGQWGLLTLSDSAGRVVAMASTDADATKNGTLLLGELKLGVGKSLYSKWGNWFAWICVGLFIFGCLSVLRGRGYRAGHVHES